MLKRVKQLGIPIKQLETLIKQLGAIIKQLLINQPLEVATIAEAHNFPVILTFDLEIIFPALTSVDSVAAYRFCAKVQLQSNEILV